jgi:uncharacterized protein
VPGKPSGPVPRFDPKHTRFRLVAGRSKINRWGVFAAERIPAGRKVIEYTGERISRRETLRRAGQKYNYLFTLNKYWTLDGGVGGSGAEFINHSCDPNLRSWNLKGHILYMSKRVIEPGEELLVDYNFEENMEVAVCRCGAPNCRGTINRM